MKSIVVSLKIDDEKRKELELRIKEVPGFLEIIYGHLSAEIVCQGKCVERIVKILKELEIPIERIIARR